MKRALYCAFFLLVAGLLGAQSKELQSQGLWNDSMYSRFTFDDFAHYEPSGREIDFSAVDYPLLNAAIFYETNRRRKRSGRTVFLHSPALERAASLHSRDMVEKSFFSHENPYDGKKRTPLLRMSASGIEGGYVAENIAEAFGIRYNAGSPVVPPEGEGGPFKDFTTGKVIPPHTYRSLAESVVEGWMRSPPHRANILDPALRYLGCGAHHYRNGSFYGLHQFKVTQNFSSDSPAER